MQSLIVYPKDKAELNFLQVIFKRMGISSMVIACSQVEDKLFGELTQRANRSKKYHEK